MSLRISKILSLEVISNPTISKFKIIYRFVKSKFFTFFKLSKQCI